MRPEDADIQPRRVSIMPMYFDMEEEEREETTEGWPLVSRLASSILRALFTRFV